MRLVIRDQGRRDGRQRAGEGRRQISDFGLRILECRLQIVAGEEGRFRIADCRGGRGMGDRGQGLRGEWVTDQE